MKESEKALTILIADWINGQERQRTAGIGAYDMQTWQDLLNLAEIHALGGICYLTLKNSVDCPAEIKEQFARIFRREVVYSIQIESEMEKMSEAFEESGICYIPFKGWELREYYPVPELRSMSDVDFLIRKEDVDAAEKALKKAGFTRGIESDSVITYTQGMLTLEMHYGLKGSLNNKIDYQAWFADAFSHGVFEDGMCEGHFEAEYHFVFLIFHLAKHMNSLGAGVRMFLDIAVFWKHFGEVLNQVRIFEMLKKLQLDMFARYVFWLCDEWFRVKIPGTEEMSDELYQLVTEYVFPGGTYGKEKRGLGDMYARRGISEAVCGHPRWQKLRGYLVFLFPEAEQMANYLNIVKKYPILLPVAWVKRWCEGLFLRRRQSLGTLKGLGTENGTAEKEYKMLKMLGIKNIS